MKLDKLLEDKKKASIEIQKPLAPTQAPLKQKAQLKDKNPLK